MVSMVKPDYLSAMQQAVADVYGQGLNVRLSGVKEHEPVHAILA